MEEDYSRGSESESYEEEDRLDYLLSNPVLEELFQKLSTRIYMPYQKVLKPTLLFGSKLRYPSDILQFRAIQLEDGKIINIFDYLMTTEDNSTVNDIYKDYGMRNEGEFLKRPYLSTRILTYTEPYTIYDLLWYINNTSNTSFKHCLLTQKELQSVIELPIEDLYILISYRQQYRGPIDKACILFTMMFGIELPYTEIGRNYDSTVLPLAIWLSADKVHHITTNRNNIYGPYLYCSKFPLTAVDKLLFSVNKRTISSIVNNYNILIPDTVPSYLEMSYVLKELSRYEPILNRHPGLDFPSNISNNFETAKEQLAPFTTLEIATKYRTGTTNWSNFDELVFAVIRM